MLTQELLKKLFIFKDGVFYWKERNKYGRVRENQRAGRINTAGHCQITIAQKSYLRSHLVWLWTHGKLPPKPFEVDHFNRIRHDDHPDNLRLATRSQQSLNAKLSKNNTSGYKGVCWHKSSQKWRATICVQGKVIELGYFDNKLDAILARIEAEIKYYDHEFYTRE